MTARPWFTRDYKFKFATRDDAPGDGFTLEGYAAVFDSPTTVRERGRTFTERVGRGAFRRTLQDRTPVLMFDHGAHASIGAVPIGQILEAHEDKRGLFIKARLFDNHLVEPVRDAIAGGAIRGMSFRFEAIRDTWSADRSERTLHELRVAELGPVVFPAYEATSVGVRGHQGSTTRTAAERQAIAARLRAGVSPLGCTSASTAKAERQAKAAKLKLSANTVMVTDGMRARWERDRQRRVGALLAQRGESTWPWLSPADVERLRGPRSTYPVTPGRNQRRYRLQRQAKELLERNKRGCGFGLGRPSR